MGLMQGVLEKFLPRFGGGRTPPPPMVMPGLAPPRQLPGLMGRVHARDFMIGGDSPDLITVYQRIGRSAMRLTEEGLLAAGRSFAEIDSLLDFGCGYGRVTREFAQHLSPAKITVFDVDPAAARFCGEEFSTRYLTFRDRWDWRKVGFAKYDCIWVGSVFTHLSQAYTRETMELLRSLLRPRGVLVFTTHGDEALRRTEMPNWFSSDIQQNRQQIGRDYHQRGFHFTPNTAEEMEILLFDFQRGADFGYTWMSEAYTRSLLASVSRGRLKVLEFRPAGWEGYQDAFFCQLS